jgi:hypothetical protein
MTDGDDTVKIDNLERGALKPGADSRPQSAREPLDSGDGLPVTEFDLLWLEQACLRAAQIDAGKVELISGEEVDRKARALLR